MWVKYSKGFTAIELMTVVVILGILVSLVFPQLLAAQNRAKNASTKANMHSIQNVIEVYAVDWGSYYPLSVSEIENEASVQSVAKSMISMKNPFNQRSGQGNGYDDEASTPHIAGVVTYQGFNDRYYLYGYNESSTRIRIRNLDFTLTNAY